MSKAVVTNVISEEIPLKKFDESGKTWVKFQRPKRWEAEQLAHTQAQSELIYNTEQRGEVRHRERVPLAIIESQMVSMCLVESNLTDEDEKQIFVPGKTCREARKELSERVQKGFYEKWHDLDNEICEEIVDLLRAWHVPFNWRAEEGEA